MTPRLTKNSRARAFLKEKLENGDLSGEEAPKAVWNSDALFKVHSLDAFRTCYNNVKAELGINSGNGTFNYFFTNFNTCLFILINFYLFLFILCFLFAT